MVVMIAQNLPMGRHPLATPVPKGPGGAPTVGSAALRRPEWGSANLDEQQVNERHPMNDTQTNGPTQHGLIQRWVEVADATGGTRLEARWAAIPAQPPLQITSAARAAPARRCI
jgi:hypothetical protein